MPSSVFSVDPGILLSLYASAHHPHTTVATGEWIVSWPGKDNPVEIPLSMAVLVFESSLHVRLVPQPLRFAPSGFFLMNMGYKVARVGLGWDQGGATRPVVVPEGSIIGADKYICSL